MRSNKKKTAAVVCQFKFLFRIFILKDDNTLTAIYKEEEHCCNCETLILYLLHITPKV